MKIIQFPLFKITFGFIIGILSFQFFQPNPTLIFGIFFLGILLLILIHFWGQQKKFLKIFFGIITLFVAFIFGITTSIIHKETYNPSHYVHLISNYNKSYLIELSISEKLKTTAKYNRYIAQIQSINDNKCSGKIIFNIKKTNPEKLFLYNNRLKIKELLYQNTKPLNPNQFDYSKYLENQEVYAQIYTESTKIHSIHKSKKNYFDITNFRNKIIQNLSLSKLGKEEQNVLIALLLGQKQDISPETLRDYQYAGAIHILSVSGLHVGFLLMFITFLLKPFPNTKKGSVLKLVIILLTLWGFGFLAGLAPSVVRSVVTFSFVAIGNYFRRSTNIFHTLTISMLIILLFKPSFLFDVGFQLSYMALFFILWLQPIFSNFWQPENKIIKYFWDILTVSVAAQIGTFPLSIYYFHQFPGLFFVTNLLVLPLIGIILFAGLVTLSFAVFGNVPEFILKPTSFLIELLNTCIHWIAGFENLIIKNISLTHPMLILWYLIIISGFLWVQKPTFLRFATVLSSIIMLQSILFLEKFKTNNLSELIIFHLPKNTLITERRNHNVVVYSNVNNLDSLVQSNTISSYMVENFSRLETKKELQNLLYFNNKKILVIDSSCIWQKIPKPDIIILINSPKLNLDRVLLAWKPKIIIADGSNYKSYIQRWKSTCHNKKILFHFTGEKGFYKL